MLPTHFEITELPESTERLRTEIREFLAETLIDYPITERMRSWMGFDAGFTKKLADKGWIGITWPKEYGGQGRDAFSRYVLDEELLAAGAPVLAHWTADRQSGPLIIRRSEERRVGKGWVGTCRSWWAEYH